MRAPELAGTKRVGTMRRMSPCQRVHHALALALALAGGAATGGCAERGARGEAEVAVLSGLAPAEKQALEAVLAEAGASLARATVIRSRAEFPLPFVLRTRLVPDRREAAPDLRAEGRARGPLVLVEGGRVTGLALRGPCRVDVAKLRAFDALALLDLDGAELANVSGLAGLGGLVYVDLSRTGLADVTPLTRLPALRALVAVKSAVRAIPSLGGTLELVDLSYARIEELPGEAPRLEVLTLTGNRVRSLRAPGPLPALATLTLDENQVEEIVGLEAYPKLVALGLGGNRVRRVPDLPSGFRYLSLAGNPVPLDPETVARVDALRGRAVLLTL